MIEGFRFDARHVSSLGLMAGLMTLLVVGCPSESAAQAPPQPPTTSTTTTPSQLLQQFQNGGPELISRLRELAANPANLQALLALVPQANAAQKSALGSALGQETRIAARTNIDYARSIQQGVAGTRDPDLLVAYGAVIGDQPIGAAGGGGGGGGGAVGGQTNPFGTNTLAGGPAEGIGGNGTPTNPFSYTSAVSGSGTPPSSNATTTTSP
jgi:hypothetical protein